MKKNQFVLSGVGLLLSIAPSVVMADTADTPSASSATTGSTPSRAALPYEELLQVISVTRLDEASAAEIRMRAGELDQQVIELQGEVLGVVVNDRTRRVVLEVGRSALLLIMAPDLDATYSSLIQPGSLVRLLARVHSSAPKATAEESTSGAANDLRLEIIAATQTLYTPAPETPAPETRVVAQTLPSAVSTLPEAPDSSEAPNSSVMTSQAPPSEVIAASPTVTGTTPLEPLDSGITVLPPMTSMRLPEPPRYSGAATPSTPKPAPAQNTLQSLLQAQKPGFKAIARRHNRRLTEAQVEEIATAIVTAAYKYNMDSRFLAAIIGVESDFDIYCVSSSGALGLGQLMPFNLKEAGVTRWQSPTQNITGTARLLRGHLDSYRGRPDATLLAVAAYNAGPGAVRRAGYKVPNGKQVQRYVWKVYYRYKEFAPDMF